MLMSNIPCIQLNPSSLFSPVSYFFFFISDLYHTSFMHQDIIRVAFSKISNYIATNITASLLCNQVYKISISIQGFSWYLHESIPKVHTSSIVGPRQVTIEGSRVELSKYKNLVYATVDAVAHWYVNKPIASSNLNLHNKIPSHCMTKSQTILKITNFFKVVFLFGS